jgi:hypothetical protein
MAVAELTLFGGFEVKLAGGQVVDLPGQKDRALLAAWPYRPAQRTRATSWRACCGVTVAISRRGTA